VAIEVRIVVGDAPPLITLAVAKSLDYLLFPQLPVTGAAGKLGAEEILDWYRAHTAQVRVEPTEIFQNEMTCARSRDGGRLAISASGRRSKLSEP
jgi:hypothetical protein